MDLINGLLWLLIHVGIYPTRIIWATSILGVTFSPLPLLTHANIPRLKNWFSCLTRRWWFYVRPSTFISVFSRSSIYNTLFFKGHKRKNVLSDTSIIYGGCIIVLHFWSESPGSSLLPPWTCNASISAWRWPRGMRFDGFQK